MWTDTHSGSPSAHRGPLLPADLDIAEIIAGLPAPVTPPSSPARPFRLPVIGETITYGGRTYVIGPELGTGSFGVVFRATDNWERELAVKVLKPVGTYEEVRQAAVDEVAKLSSLRHTRITYVYDAFEYDNAFYIVSEQCGLPVASLLEPPHFGQIWVRPIARCLLDALAYMHDNGYVHQDVHLNNVFIAWTKSELLPDSPPVLSFKLGDLGLAKPVKDINPVNTMLAEWMLPPEFLDGVSFGPMDHRIDIYHAALLMLQILIGDRLTLTRQDVVDGVPRQIAETLSTPLGDALAHGLRRHVEDRPATALAFWELIRNATTT